MKLLDFTDRSNPLGPSQKARHAIRKAIRAVAAYPDEQAPYLRRLIAKKEGVSPDTILFGHGISHLLHLVLQVHAPESVAVPGPISLYLSGLIERHHTRVHPLPMEMGTPAVSIDRLTRALDEADLLLVPNPHPLTGSVIPRDALALLINQAEQMNKLLVFDEASIEYTTAASPVRLVAGSPHALILRSFSLFHALAGLRIGYALGHPETLARLAPLIEPYPVNSLAAAAAVSSLRDSGYRTRTLKFLSEEKSYLKGKLARLHLEAIDTPSNLVLVPLKENATDRPGLLRDAGVLVFDFASTEGLPILSVPVRRRPLNAAFMRLLARTGKQQ
jgi:threonine-phosphate decarboxylase